MQARILRHLLLRLPSRKLPLGNLLVVAPHPDDEILGLGGVILSNIHHGHLVDILYLTDGEGANVHPDRERVRAERMKMTEAVRLSIGLSPEHLHRFRLPDGGVPKTNDSQFESLAQRLANLIDRLEPDYILVTHPLDYWPFDHPLAAALVQASLKKSRHQPVLYGYWVWAWYNLRPWHFGRLPSETIVADVGPWSETKRALMELYLRPRTESGKPWSGVLPTSLLSAFQFNLEVMSRM
jgi:LmbE family N-acetylglucosaminyl deacetylase